MKIRSGGDIKVESTKPSTQLDPVSGPAISRPGGKIPVDAPSPSPVLTKVNEKPLQTDTSGSVTDKPKNNTSADKLKTTSGTTQYQDIGVTPSESIQNKQLVDNPQTQRTENGLNITHYGGDADGDYVGPDQRELAEKQGYDVQQEKWSDDTIHYRIFKK